MRISSVGSYHAEMLAEGALIPGHVKVSYNLIVGYFFKQKLFVKKPILDLICGTDIRDRVND